MTRVYVSSKLECPSDAVLREGEKGALYYNPEERGTSSEVGGNIKTFESLLDGLEKEINRKARIYVGSPEEVPDKYTPQRGDRGGWFYDTQEGPSNFAEGVSESLQDMVSDIVRLVAEDNRGQMDPSRADLEDMADHLADMNYDIARQKAEEILGKIQKSRVYVSSPDEVPEQYEVQEGSRGGYFYETGEHEQEYADGTVDVEAIAERTARYASRDDTVSSADDVFDDGFLHEQVVDQFPELGMYDELNDDDKEMVDSIAEEIRDELSNEMDNTIENTEKNRVYISDPDEAPEGVNVQEGDRGGYYYETDNGAEPDVDVPDGLEDHGAEYAEREPDARADMIMDELEETGHLDELVDAREMAPNRPAEDVVEPLLDEMGVGGEEYDIALDELSSYADDESNLERSQKSRVYISDPEEAPDGVSVEEGARGGYYYETGSGGGSSGGADMSGEALDPDNYDFESMDEGELNDLRQHLMDQHSEAREAREARGGRGTDTPEDELMRDILDVVMDLDDELLERANKSRDFVSLDELEI